jgi:CRP-like cAMP-binding protein
MRTAAYTSFRRVRALRPVLASVFSRPMNLAPGTHLSDYGRVPQLMYFIEQGIVKEEAPTEDGRTTITNLFSQGHLVNARAVMFRRGATTLSALTSLTVRTLVDHDLFDLLSNSADFRDYVTRVFALEAYAGQWVNLVLRARSARGRLVSLLSTLADGTMVTRDGSPIEIVLPLSQVEMSQLLSLTPEHLSRLIRELERDGLISRGKSIWRLNGIDRAISAA